jgi:hypothetical protein
MPALPGVTARERSLALMALTIGGLLLARASGTAAVGGEVLAACQKWARRTPPHGRRRITGCALVSGNTTEVRSGLASRRFPAYNWRSGHLVPTEVGQ